MPEEFRIGEAGPQHPLVAAADRGRRFGAPVADAEETGQQHPIGLQGQGVGGRIGPQQGHIALVGAHHRAEHLRRQRQEARFDRPLDQLGRLHQVHQLVEQRLRQIQPAASLHGRLLQVLADPGGAGVPLHLHVMGGEGGGVDAGIGDLQGVVLQPMAAAEAVAAQRRIAFGQRHRHHLGIEQGHQPPHRAAEAALARPPAHEATALQAPQPGGDQRGQQRRGGLAPLQGARKDERALLRLAHLQGLRIHATAAGKAKGRLGGLAIAKRLLGRRTLALGAQIVLPLRQTLDGERQASGRAGAAHRRERQAQALQVHPNQLPQLGQGLPSEIGRQLLRADLQQKGGHGTTDAGGDFMEQLPLP